MIRLKLLFFLIIFLLIFPVFNSCDEEDQDPYLIINISVKNFTGTLDEDHRFHVIYFLLPDWSQPLIVNSSADYQIIMPGFEGSTFYLVLFHDEDGDGELSTGDPYVGWNNVTDPASDLTPIPFLSLDFMAINIELDGSSSYPTAY